jgi:hypothetical protein
MIISRELVNELRDLVYTKHYEICANLKVKDNYPFLELDNINKGKDRVDSTGKIRKSCEFKEMSNILFHTHPKASYSYPSVEDIMKLIKRHGVVERSVIATKWGIWDIKNMNNTSNYCSEAKDVFNRTIQYFTDRIGRYTRNKSSASSDKSISITPSDDMTIINDCIYQLQLILNISIKLYLWDAVDRDGIVLN